jgi:hypothetical protein
MKKKHVYSILVVLLPFLCVWTAFIATAGAFSVQDVFQSSAFWNISLVYWIMFQWLPLYAISESNQ